MKSFTLTTTAMLLCLISAVSAVDLQSVLDHNLKALGGREAVAAQRNVEAYSTIEYMGIRGQAVTIVDFPNRYYTFMDLGGMKEIKGFDGLTAWTTDANGVTRRDISEEMKPMINELYLDSYSYLLPDRIPGRNEFRGDTLIDGRTCYQVAMFPVGGDSLFVFIDSADGRLVYRSERVTGLRMNTTYLDFRKVEGVDMPFATEVITPGAPYQISAWTDSIRVNTDIPDSVFAMPGHSVIDYDFPSGLDSVEIAFQTGRFGIVVEIYVNGKGPFKFMLDSGAATTIVSKSLAGKLDLATIGDIPARGVGGYGSLGLSAIDSINIGSLVWHLDRVTIYDFSTFTGGAPAGVDGILGYDFFVRFPMMIDFDSDRLTLYNASAWHPALNKDTAVIELYCQIPVVEIAIDGHPLRAALDLGAQTGLVVQAHSRWYGAAREAIKGHTREVDIMGIGGEETVRSYLADSLRLGNLEVYKPEVLIADNPDAIPFPDYIEGFLGLNIIRRYNLLLDYPDRRVTFFDRGPSDK